jgi:hypothetical protein
MILLSNLLRRAEALASAYGYNNHNYHGGYIMKALRIDTTRLAECLLIAALLSNGLSVEEQLINDAVMVVNESIKTE